MISLPEKLFALSLSFAFWRRPSTPNRYDVSVNEKPATKRDAAKVSCYISIEFDPGYFDFFS